VAEEATAEGWEEVVQEEVGGSMAGGSELTADNCRPKRTAWEAVTVAAAGAAAAGSAEGQEAAATEKAEESEAADSSRPACTAPEADLASAGWEAVAEAAAAVAVAR